MARPKEMKDGVPVAVRLPGALYERLKKKADAQERSISWVIRKILEKTK